MPSFEHTKQGRVSVEDEVYKPGDNKQNNLEPASSPATDSDQNNRTLSRPGISWGELAKDKSKEKEVQETTETAPAAEATLVAETGNTAGTEESEPAAERPKPTPFNDRDLPDPGPAFLQKSAAQMARQEEENLQKKRGVRGRNRVVSASAKKTEPSFGEISSPAEVKESLSGRMAHPQPNSERRRVRKDTPASVEVEEQDTQSPENTPVESGESRDGNGKQQPGEERPPRRRKRSRNRNRNRDNDGENQARRDDRRPDSREKEKCCQDLSNKPNAPRSAPSAKARPKGLFGKIVNKISSLFGGQPKTENHTSPQASGPSKREDGTRKDSRPRKPGDGRPPHRRRRPHNRGKGNPRHTRNEAS